MVESYDLEKGQVITCTPSNGRYECAVHPSTDDEQNIRSHTIDEFIMKNEPPISMEYHIAQGVKDDGTVRDILIGGITLDELRNL